jgi:DNA-binding winged helix-turn-helix (wHTH) protein
MDDHVMSPAPTERVISFDSFQLFPVKRILLEAGRRLRVGDRALDILIALVERHGEVLSKSELLKRAWPATSVEEDNLKVHVAALRRAMGDGSGGKRNIVSVQGRGYVFVSSATSELVDAKIDAKAGKSGGHNLPTLNKRLIGRSNLVTFSDYSEAHGSRDRFRTGCRTQARKNMFCVGFYGLWLDTKLLGNFFVRVTETDQFKNFSFTRS